MHIHQAMAPYEVRKVRKQEMVGKELNRSKKGIHMLNEILNSMNLPAALENITGGGVPASLREKNATGMNLLPTTAHRGEGRIMDLIFPGRIIKKK